MALRQGSPKDIVSFNQELMSFDVADTSVEGLERRLELAVAQIAVGRAICPLLCETDCPSDCPTNCTVVCYVHSSLPG